MKADPALSRSEWDFRRLFGEELTAATFYEYARESASMRSLAARYASLPGLLRDRIEGEVNLWVLANGAPAEAEIEKLSFIRFWNCILWPDYFPNTPWLDIPGADRRDRMARFLAANPQPVVLAVNSHKLEPQDLPPENGRLFSGSGENLALWIDWGRANNSELASHFATWLAKHRPAGQPEPRGDGSREVVDEAFMTRLGIMRLLHELKYLDAAKAAKAVGWIIPAQSEAGKKRHGVAKDLHRFFRTEHFIGLSDLWANPDEPAAITQSQPLLSPEEMPLHFATAIERNNPRKRKFRFGVEAS